MIKLTKAGANKVQSGYPWIWKNWIESSDIYKGDIVNIEHSDNVIGKAYVNSQCTLSGRVLSLNYKEEINKDWVFRRLKTALDKRKALFRDKYYRLVHSESDGLPGLIVDRYGEFLVCSFNTSGMDNLQSYVIESINELINPSGIVIDNTSSFRSLEGLEQEFNVLYKIPNIVTIHENGLKYYACLLKGQKTGWFFDQRSNREYIKDYCEGKRVLDLFCYTGGFGLSAARVASHVTMVDSSDFALELASRAGSMFSNVSYVKECVFEYLDKTQERFDVIISDPPAYVKNKADLSRGLCLYKKLFKKCEGLLNHNGIIFFSSCSQPVTYRDLAKFHSGKLQRSRGADKDHPVHALLPETKYLKFMHLSY